MSHSDELAKIRTKLQDALRSGILSQDTYDTTQTLLIGLLNEAERGRQHAEAEAQRLTILAAKEAAKVDAFNTQLSVIYAMLNSYLQKQQMVIQELKRIAEEKATAVQATVEPTS